MQDHARGVHDVRRHDEGRIDEALQPPPRLLGELTLGPWGGSGPQPIALLPDHLAHDGGNRVR